MKEKPSSIMDNKVLKRVVTKYLSPCFLFDIDELIERVERIRQLLESARDKDSQELPDNKIGLCYSIKANPFLVPFLVNVVDKFEVCSPGELEIVKHYNISPDKIIYSGVNKGIDDVREAMEYEVAVITAESRGQLELIKEMATSRDSAVNVILRLTSGNQFGMSLDDIRSILQIAPYPNIDIIGVHYFAGTQRNNPKPQDKELRKLIEIMNDLRQETKIGLEMIEYGPGLSYPYFDTDDFSDTLMPLKNILPMLGEVTNRFQLTIEMGRFIASSCGHYITSICDIKESEGKKWCILDGGLNHVNYYGQMMGMKRPIIRHLSKALLDETDESSKNDGLGDCYSYALCGSLCTSNDILVREYELTDAKIGDVLVFENVGAYSITEGIGLFLSRDMAKVIVCQNGELNLLRDTVESWKINCF